jgi:hypothetical protein
MNVRSLLASALDRASTVCLTVGVATPVAGLLYGVSPHIGPVTLIALFGDWLAVAVGLHLAARHLLGRLKE